MLNPRLPNHVGSSSWQQPLVAADQMQSYYNGSCCCLQWICNIFCLTVWLALGIIEFMYHEDEVLWIGEGFGGVSRLWVWAPRWGQRRKGGWLHVPASSYQFPAITVWQLWDQGFSWYPVPLCQQHLPYHCSKQINISQCIKIFRLSTEAAWECWRKYLVLLLCGSCEFKPVLVFG